MALVPMVSAVATDDPEMAALVPGNGDESEVRRQMTLFVERVTNMWSEGKLDVPDHIESFERFDERVSGGLDHVMDREGRGRRIAIVTSGGPISISLQRALDLSHDVMWRTAWVIRNASITEFLYRHDAFSLVSFNAVPHLSGDLITYR